MKRFYKLVPGGFLLGGLLISGSSTASSSCDKTPVPPQSIQAIGRDMIVNGVPMSIVGMEFAGTIDDVSKTFREFWTREDVPAKGQTSSSGLLLSALDGSCLYVLNLPQQPESAHTRGLMSAIQLGKDPIDHRIPDSAVPLPEEGKVLSDVESHDPGQTGRTWILDMPRDARWNARRYHNALVIQGWAMLGRQPDFQSTGIESAQGTAFAMQHGRNSLDVSFSDRDGRTVAVVNATRNR